jgi:hypothetical protein
MKKTANPIYPADSNANPSVPSSLFFNQTKQKQGRGHVGQLPAYGERKNFWYDVPRGAAMNSIFRL